MNTLTISNVSQVAIQLDPSFLEARSAALAKADAVKAVTDAAGQQVAVDVIRSIQEITSRVEQSRKDVKAPVLEIGKRIDELARQATQPLIEAKDRIQRLASDYAAEQARIAREAEAKRQAEERRITEEKRKAEEAEAKAREAIARAASEEARKKAEAERQAAIQKTAELSRAVAPLPTPEVAKPQGMAVRSVPKFEVHDINELANARRDLVVIEPNRSAILAAIRAGQRDIPGLFIWEEKQTVVR